MNLIGRRLHGDGPTDWTPPRPETSGRLRTDKERGRAKLVERLIELFSASKKTGVKAKRPHRDDAAGRLGETETPRGRKMNGGGGGGMW